MNYITVTEFANWNPVLDLSAYTDVTISGMIRRASRYVDGFLEYSLDLESVVDEKAEAVVNSTGELVVYTRKGQVQSVEEINIVIGSSVVTLQLTDGAGNSNVIIPSRKTSFVYPWLPFAYTGTVPITNFFALRNWDCYTKCSYTAGYTTDNMPDDIKDAVNLLTLDIFMRGANPQLLSSMSQGGISMSFQKGNGDGKSSYKMEAENMLNHYKRVVGV